MLLESFSEGFFLGLGAAVPFGPVNILIMNMALKNYKTGVTFGLGAMSSDILYLVLILAGMIGFMNSPLFLDVAGVVGSLFLLYLAYGIYKNRNKKLDTKQKAIKTKNLIKIYTQGFVITLVNPYTIIFWFSIAGYAANKDLDIAFTLLGMISSILLWITLMPYLVHRSKHKISQRVSKYLSLFSSIILLGFAISLFVDVVFL